MTWRVASVGNCWIAIDLFPGIKRMGHAPHLVFDLEQQLVVAEIYNVDEPILVLVAFLAHKIALQKPLVGSREIREVDGYVMSIVGRQWCIDFAKDQRLTFAGSNLCGWLSA